MRIDLNSAPAAGGAGLEKASSSSAANLGAGRSRQPELPESGGNVGKLASAALNAPEVRGDKVQGLRAQLQSGTYHVSASQVAGSMIEQMRVNSK